MTSYAPAFTAEVVERALVTVLERVATEHLATEPLAMSDAIVNNFENREVQCTPENSEKQLDS